MKRWAVIVAFALIGVIALIVYAQQQPPTDLETKGPGETVATVSIAYVSLATAIVSLATSVVGLLMKLIDLKDRARREP